MSSPTSLTIQLCFIVWTALLSISFYVYDARYTYIVSRAPSETCIFRLIALSIIGELIRCVDPFADHAICSFGTNRIFVVVFGIICCNSISINLSNALLIMLRRLNGVKVSQKKRSHACSLKKLSLWINIAPSTVAVVFIIVAFENRSNKSFIDIVNIMVIIGYICAVLSICIMIGNVTFKTCIGNRCHCGTNDSVVTGQYEQEKIDLLQSTKNETMHALYITLAFMVAICGIIIFEIIQIVFTDNTSAIDEENSNNGQYFVPGILWGVVLRLWATILLYTQWIEKGATTTTTTSKQSTSNSTNLAIAANSDDVEVDQANTNNNNNNNTNAQRVRLTHKEILTRFKRQIELGVPLSDVTIVKHKSYLLQHYIESGQTFTCENGSTIVWNEFGALDGFPIIYFHGGTCSRLEGLLYDKAAKECGFKMICMDRAGVGDSTLPPDINPRNRHEEYSIKLYFNDICQWLIHLGIKNEQFGIGGFSQGGEFAIPALLYLYPMAKLNPKFVVLWAPIPLLFKPVEIDNDNHIDKNKDNHESKSSEENNNQRGISSTSQVNSSYSSNSGTVEYENVIPKVVTALLGFMGSWIGNTVLMTKVPRYLVLKHPAWDIMYFWKAITSQSARDVLNGLHFDDGMNGWDFLAEMNQHSMYKTISGLLWSGNILTNEHKWGFELKDICKIHNNKDVKIFHFCGEDDKVLPAKWQKYYHYVLTNYYGMNNIELIGVENNGHWCSQSAYRTCFVKLQQFVQH